MATTSGTIWSEKVIYSGAPEVKSTATYSYERNGTKLKIKVDTTNHCTSSGAYWDWRWAFSVTVNGTQIANNIQIKPRTYLNIIGTTQYSASTGWTEIDIGTADETVISISYFDTEAGNNDKIRKSMGGGSFTLKGITPLPTVEIDASEFYPNTTDTSIKVSFSVQNSWDYVTFYVNGNEYKKIYSNNIENPVLINGLEPDTIYKINAKAYGNGAYGKKSNTIEFMTFSVPSVVKSYSIDEITPFTITISCKSSNTYNTSKYELSLCDSNKQVLKVKTLNTSTYTFSDLQDETSYYIRMRVKSLDSGAWSDYVYTKLITTEADQAQSYFKKNNIFTKGKMYFKQSGRWKKVKKAYIKVNGVWVLTKNK